jgi:hypothetical protein
VYPNPTSGHVKIRFSTSASKDVRIMLFDSKGRRLRIITNRRMTKGEVLNKRVDLRSIASGKYYIKVNNGNKVLERALIKIQ